MMPLFRKLAAAAILLATGAGGALAQPSFVPVYQRDFPDPHIIEHKGEYVAYSTNSAGINLPMLVSRDLLTWTEARAPGAKKRLDGMPQLASWVQEGRTWAPEVMEIGGRWVLYYTARHRKLNTQCIGVATAGDPKGPFRDVLSEPIVCQPEIGGTIDASPFRDQDGQLYLYFKNDGNSIGKPTDLWAQKLNPSGTAVIGQAVALLRNDKPWEAHVIESPTMVRTPAGYTMLFSANHYGWETHQRLSPYAMGYASCRSAMGPCTDAPDNPVLYSYSDKKLGCLSGPGHQTVFQAGARSYIAFHAWAATSGCRKLENQRYMYIAPLGWKDGKPLIGQSLRKRK